MSSCLALGGILIDSLILLYGHCFFVVVVAKRTVIVVSKFVAHKE